LAWGLPFCAQDFRNNSGSFAIFAAMRRASSRVSLIPEKQ
jgi:hypothetical protein